MIFTSFTGYSVQHSSIGEAPPKESDSVIMARHVHEIRVQFALEEFSEHSFNAHYTEEQLDSLMWENTRSRIAGSGVTWSSDSAFRICTIEIESCGGYCNSEWTSWLHFNDGTELVINRLDIGNVTQIDRLPDGKYLVMETSHGRSSTYACRNNAAHVISFEEHEIIFHPFAVSELTNETYETFSVGVCTDMITDCKLTYNSSTLGFSYVYGQELNQMEAPDSVYVYSGIFVYEDSIFVLSKSEQHRIKYEME